MSRGVQGHDCALIILFATEREDSCEGGCPPPICNQSRAHGEERQRSDVHDPGDRNEPQWFMGKNDPASQQERSNEWNKQRGGVFLMPPLMQKRSDAGEYADRREDHSSNQQ